MSLTMELAHNITYTGNPSDVSFLANVNLLAIATHPTSTTLLYALYGYMLALGSYQSYHLQVWDAVDNGFGSQALIGNTTLNTSSLSCVPACELEVSQNLLLIESKFQIVLYQLNNNTHDLVDTVPLKEDFKMERFMASFLMYRQMTVYKDFSIFFNGTYLEILQYQISNIPSANATILNSYQQNFIDRGTAIRIINNGQYIIWASNLNNIAISYLCLPCFQSNLNTPPTVIQTGKPASSSLNLTIGRLGVRNSVLWVNPDIQALRYQIVSDTTFTLLPIASTNSMKMITSNSQQVIFYETTSFNAYSFSTANNSFLTTYFSASPTQYMMAINPNSQLLSVHDRTDTQTIGQYQILSSCQDFNATVSGNRCLCIDYSSLYCAALNEEEDEQGESLSIGIIIGAVVGGLAVGVLVTYIVYKKCFSAVAKRTPYHYNPVELMSFQV